MSFSEIERENNPRVTQMDRCHKIDVNLLSLHRTLSDLGIIRIYISKGGLCPSTTNWPKDVNDFTNREMNRTLKIHEFFRDNLRSFQVTIHDFHFPHDHHNRLKY